MHKNKYHLLTYLTETTAMSNVAPEPISPMIENVKEKKKITSITY